MKKLLFILIMLPTLLLGQKDSAKNAFKIGDRKVVALVGENIYFENHPIPFQALAKGCRLKLFGYGDGITITSFVISYQLANTFCDRKISGSAIPKDILEAIQNDGYNFATINNIVAYLIIRDIIYTSKDRATLSIAPITLTVIK